MGKLRMSHKK